MITATGIGSGLNLDSLIGQLVTAERDPTLNRLNRREAEFQASLSGLGLLRSALANFRSAVDPLRNAASFGKRTVTLSVNGLFSATPADNAAIGRHEVEVKNLALAHKLVSTGYATSDTQVGTGALTITAGSEAIGVIIDSSNDTLLGVRDAINTAANGKVVSATIVNADDGLGGVVSKLLLTSIATGSANQIGVVVSDTDGNNDDATGLSNLAYVSGGTQNLAISQVAQDAQVVIDGQTITRAGNTLSDAITGVTLTLAKAEIGTKVTLDVALDRAAVRKLVTDLVGSYNSLRQTIAKLSSFNKDTDEAGLLLGDPTLRGVDRQLRAVLFGDNGASAGLPNLNAMGITPATDGSLNLDTGKLETAIAGNFDDFATFFGSSGGMAARLISLADDYIGANGTIPGRLTILTTSVGRVGDQRELLSQRLSNLEQRLRIQFNAMDRLVASLSSTGNFLTQQLANLPGSVFRNTR